MFVDFLIEYIGPPNYPHYLNFFEVTHVILSVKKMCGLFLSIYLDEYSRQGKY